MLPSSANSMRLALLLFLAGLSAQVEAQTTVLHAARLLDIEHGRVLQSWRSADRRRAHHRAGATVRHPAGAELLDLGDTTLMPG